MENQESIKGLKKQIICKYCNQKYRWSSAYDNKVFCSEKCKKDYDKKHNLPTEFKEERNCNLCDSIFIWSSFCHNRKFCSEECGKEYGKNKLKKIYNNRFLKLRFDIITRDNFTCQYCGRNVTDDKIKINVDHIIPKAKGGLNKKNNLITSCRECNLGKSDVLLNQRIIDKLKLRNKLAREHR